MRSLTLHVGLPKTGTSTLQKHVFPHAPFRLLQDLNQGRSPADQRDMALPFRPGWLEDRKARHSRLKLHTSWIKSLDDEVFFLSSETLSAWSSPGCPKAIWPVMNTPGDCPRSDTHPLVDFLVDFRDCLSPEVQLKNYLDAPQSG